MEVTGRRPTAGVLIVSNHRSYVDIVALGGLVEMARNTPNSISPATQVLLATDAAARGQRR